LSAATSKKPTQAPAPPLPELDVLPLVVALDVFPLPVDVVPTPVLVAPPAPLVVSTTPPHDTAKTATNARAKDLIFEG
jgi:hypothetical protein